MSASHFQPTLGAGFGFRKPHYAEVIETAPCANAGAWLEVHSENFFADGGPALATLHKARALYPISLHGVGLSLASAEGVDAAHLAKLKRLVDRIEPMLVSEHLCWAQVGAVHLNDLLPFAYTQQALNVVAKNVSEVQDAIKRPLLLENISRYLELQGSDMTEAQFLSALVKRTGCELLLDINNVYVNARNLGVDAWSEIAQLPAEAIKEIHLAGFSDEDGLLIDTHSARVAPEVWQLYERALEHIGPVPTLIEWDQALPPLHVLLAEVAQAAERLETHTTICI
jgi:uncharacterized protein